MDTDQVTSGEKRVLWYLGESAWAEPAQRGEAAEETEEEEEEGD